MLTCKRITAMLLFAVCLCVCLGGFAFAADSREDMQQAIVQTAIAYYLNKADQQYDSVALSKDYDRDDGGNLRCAFYFAPEDATPDQTEYSVCSEYCFEVLYNALGYQLVGEPRKSVTRRMQNEVEGPHVVFRFNNRNATEAEKDAAAEKAWSLLQPGDVVVYGSTKSVDNRGHAMVFVGDIDGKGEPDLLHSTGKKYNMGTGEDAVEENGTIKKANAETYFHPKGKSHYFGQLGMYTILRAIDDPGQTCAITPWARTRMQYPWMRCVHTVSTGCYGAAEAGGKLTYMLRIYNRGKEDFKDLPVTYPLPEGTELERAPEAKVDGRNLSWTLDIPAGKTKTLYVTVKVTSPMGAEIVSDKAKVGQIPMKVLTTVVGGSREGLRQLEDPKRFSERFAGERAAYGTAFANAVYRCGMGVEIGLPDAGALFDALCTKANVPGHDFCTLRDDYRNSTVGKMVVRHWIGGRLYTAKSDKERVRETRLEDLQCGDLIFVATKLPMTEANTAAYYCNGNDLIAYRNGKLQTENPDEVTKLLSKPFFVALRPVQAFEDLDARSRAAARFDDVKNTDWFYSYVNALAADGAISGMTETTFAPNGTLTYGQALKLIASALGEKEPAKSGAHWASGYLTLAKQKGWLGEDVDLDGTITRLALCRIAAKAKGLSAKAGFNPFTDTDDASVLALYQANVVSGITAAEFKPDAPLTRAQIAKIIWTLRKV